MQLKQMCAISALCLTVACGNSAPQLKQQMPANLTAPCEDLVDIEENQVSDLVLWSVEAANQYRICKEKHRKLSEAVDVQVQ